MTPRTFPIWWSPSCGERRTWESGSRYINGNKKDTPLYRRLGQRVLDTATNLDSGLAVTDSQSGFRAFTGAAKCVIRFHQNGLAIESEMLADAAAASGEGIKGSRASFGAILSLNFIMNKGVDQIRSEIRLVGISCAH